MSEVVVYTRQRRQILTDAKDAALEYAKPLILAVASSSLDHQYDQETLLYPSPEHRSNARHLCHHWLRTIVTVATVYICDAS